MPCLGTHSRRCWSSAGSFRSCPKEPGQIPVLPRPPCLLSLSEVSEWSELDLLDLSFVDFENPKNLRFPRNVFSTLFYQANRDREIQNSNLAPTISPRTRLFCQSQQQEKGKLF